MDNHWNRDIVGVSSFISNDPCSSSRFILVVTPPELPGVVSITSLFSRPLYVHCLQLPSDKCGSAGRLTLFILLYEHPAWTRCSITPAAQPSTRHWLLRVAFTEEVAARLLPRRLYAAGTVIIAPFLVCLFSDVDHRLDPIALATDGRLWIAGGMILAGENRKDLKKARKGWVIIIALYIKGFAHIVIRFLLQH